MRLFVSTAGLGLVSAETACNTKCSIDTLTSSITNKGTGDFYVECNEEATKASKETQGKKRRDYYDIICNGELHSTFNFQSLTAKKKCSKARTITCGDVVDTCGGCDPNLLAQSMLNTNEVPGRALNF